MATQTDTWFKPTHRLKGAEQLCMLLDVRSDHVVIAYRPSGTQRQTDVSSTMSTAVFRHAYERLS